MNPEARGEINIVILHMADGGMCFAYAAWE